MIERNTLAHKYRRVRRPSETDEDAEKCAICLSLFEIGNDVRYVLSLICISKGEY